MKATLALALVVLLVASPAGAALLPGADARLAAELLTQAPDSSSMPPKATGNVYEKAGRWYARVRLGPSLRPSIALPTCSTEAEALARLPILTDLAAKLRASGQLDRARAILERAATRTGKALDDVTRIVDALGKGDLSPTRSAAASAAAVTVKAIGERWTSGDLSRKFPDHVRAKASADHDVGRLERYVYPIAQDIPIADFTLDDAEAVMRTIPAERSPATRRHVAQILHRLLSIAVFPLRLRASNPLPRGFMPKVGPAKAKGWIYPSEDAALLASPVVPLAWRVFYGFLDREGARSGEAGALTFADVDLERGAVNLDENKTDDPRAWALSPGVAAALHAWRAVRETSAGNKLAADAPVFVDDAGERIDGDSSNLAKQFRAHLKAAGIDRPALFERSASRQQIRLHDLRATFVTLALANGRSETWVADRTGHRSSQMINKYRRAARTAAELGLGDVAPLDVAIPELRATSGQRGGGGGQRDRAKRAKDWDPTRARGRLRSLGTPTNAGEFERSPLVVVGPPNFESPNHGWNPCTGTGVFERSPCCWAQNWAHGRAVGEGCCGRGGGAARGCGARGRRAYRADHVHPRRHEAYPRRGADACAGRRR